MDSVTLAGRTVRMGELLTVGVKVQRADGASLAGSTGILTAYTYPALALVGPLNAVAMTISGTNVLQAGYDVAFGAGGHVTTPGKYKFYSKITLPGGHIRVWEQLIEVKAVPEG